MRRTKHRAAWLAALAAASCAIPPGAASSVDFTGLDFSVDGYCVRDEDVFAADGHGHIHHLERLGDQLVKIREIAVNPDVESCVVGRDVLYILDPILGVLAAPRDAERELALVPVYLSPPHGSGAIEVYRLDIERGDAFERIVVEDKDGGRDEVRVPLDPVTVLPGVYPSAETAPVVYGGDAADDAVIVKSPEDAMIIATDKRFGLRIYDLDGRQRQEIATGRLNNVDAIALADGAYLVAASNRHHLSIDLLRWSGRKADVVELTGRISLSLEDPYGLCMHESDGEISVFVGDKDGRVEEWIVEDGRDAMQRRHFEFDSQTEGCVVDPGTGVLYVGEEESGIWAIDLKTESRRRFASVGDGLLVADVEGLDIFNGGAKKLLLASSQGDHSFVAYDLDGGLPVGKFRIGANLAAGVDGVSETDGIAIHEGPLPGYPKGLLVVQDGHNVAPDENQNFKLVDWQQISRLLSDLEETRE